MAARDGRHTRIGPEVGAGTPLERHLIRRSTTRAPSPPSTCRPPSTSCASDAGAARPPRLPRRCPQSLHPDGRIQELQPIYAGIPPARLRGIQHRSRTNTALVASSSGSERITARSAARTSFTRRSSQRIAPGSPTT